MAQAKGYDFGDLTPKEKAFMLAYILGYDNTQIHDGSIRIECKSTKINDFRTQIKEDIRKKLGNLKPSLKDSKTFTHILISKGEIQTKSGQLQWPYLEIPEEGVDILLSAYKTKQAEEDLDALCDFAKAKEQALHMSWKDSLKKDQVSTSSDRDTPSPRESILEVKDSHQPMVEFTKKVSGSRADRRKAQHAKNAEQAEISPLELRYLKAHKDFLIKEVKSSYPNYTYPSTYKDKKGRNLCNDETYKSLYRNSVHINHEDFPVDVTNPDKPQKAHDDSHAKLARYEISSHLASHRASNERARKDAGLPALERKLEFLSAELSPGRSM